MEPTTASPRQTFIRTVAPDLLPWYNMYKVGEFVSRMSGFSSIYSWCQQRMTKKSKESDVSREANFQEEIQTALNKIELLERELNILKKDKQDGSYNLVQPTLCSPCQCLCARCGQPLDKKQSSVSEITTSSVPPPPPPLPPPPPPATPSSSLMTTRIKPKRKIIQENENRVFLVTEEALKSVKLRQRQKTVDSEPGKQTLGEAQINSIKLRNCRPEGILQEDVTAMIAKEAVKFKRTLKKTDMKRSPGGTPLVNKSRKRVASSPSNLTSVMYSALQEKFATANTSIDDKDDTENDFPKRSKKSPLHKQCQRKSPRLSEGSPKNSFHHLR